VNTRVFVAASAAAALIVVGAFLLFGPAGSTPAEGDVATTQAANVPAGPVEAPAAPRAPAPEPSRGSRRAAAAPAGSEDGPAPSADAVPEAAPLVGTLRIESDVPGAQVFIDRQFVGTAPVTAENVKPGTHQLNVSAEGFEGVARTIDVEAGARDLMVRFKEVRIDSRLAVVHKHRMGSCTGALVATVQGLRYETADKDDQFAVSFADVETFVIDYTDKNLRVKVRKGKQYNFTDPDGSADKLFVFHRDVDKARQRLAKGDAPAPN
jgi:hypothetical protein